MEPPSSVDVRPLPGDDYRTGFRLVCPDCDAHVWARADGAAGDPFSPAPCPSCGRDIRLAVNVALSDARLAGLRDRGIRLSARPR